MRFPATMSHELRTRLNSIVGFADILLDRDDLVPDARRQIGLIQAAGEGLLNVVNDILDFSRIEEGRLELSSAEFDLRALIDLAVAMVRRSADAKELGLRLSIDPRISRLLLGDEQRIRQILLTLLNTAINATKTGHVSLDADLLKADEVSQRVRLSISCAGTGQPDHTADRLFRDFSQIDGPASQQYDSGSLGLVISRRLVEMMDGTIGIENATGAGPTVSVSLTLPRATRPSADASPGGPAPDTTPAHLLLVEDVEINSEIACAILDSIGYSVDAVFSGADAIAAVQKQGYDLVLMDIQMPGMDGIAATRTIRALPGRAANVPIIAITANVLPDQVAATRAAGMNGYVAKPFKRDRLRDEIERCLSLAGRMLEPPQSREPEPERPGAMLADLLGSEEVNRLFEAFKSRLEQFVATDAPSAVPSEIARQAHHLVSSAGMLGYSELADYCARLERAIVSRDATGVTFNQAREICVAAIAEITVRLSEIRQANQSNFKNA